MTSFKTPPRGELKWLAVDLDDTIAKGVWTPESADPGIGPPKWRNIDKMADAYHQGWKIIIHTSRPWHDYEMIESWLKHWDYLDPYDRLIKVSLARYVSRIVCGKLLAAAYIDDRAIHESEDSWVPKK